MLELAKYAKQHIPEQHPKVREHGWWLISGAVGTHSPTGKCVGGTKVSEGTALGPLGRWQHGQVAASCVPAPK